MKNIFYCMGFRDFNEFFQSLIRFDLKPHISAITISIGSLMTITLDLLEYYYGFPPIVISFLFASVIVDYITGIAVARRKFIKYTKKYGLKCAKNKPVFSVQRFQRGFFKFSIYTIIIMTFNIFSKAFGNYYDHVFVFLHGATSSFVILVYILSISENMVKLGYKEFDFVNKITKKKIEEITI